MTNPGKILIAALFAGADNFIPKVRMRTELLPAIHQFRQANRMRA